MARAVDARPQPQAEHEAEAGAEKKYRRFDLSQRIQHMLLLISFSLLGITGLAQKYSANPIGEGVLALFGGIQGSRVVHRTAAVVLMAVSIFHIIDVLYRVIVLRTPLTMLPVVQDFIHLYHDVLYYFGRRTHKAYYGRYNYAEKAEYLAVVWGTVIMAITGFMMWNPISTTQYLPGEYIPAAKAAHGGEALLAVLAIILWHFYHVHFRHFNKSMFTGTMSRHEMEDEHPAELSLIETGQAARRPKVKEVRRREQIFFPIAIVLTLGLSYALYRFVTFEQTAITTLPRGEDVEVFVPITATPTATPIPSPTPLPGQGVAVNTWEDGAARLIDNRCGSCHVQGSLGGLSLGTYQDALEGGISGPAIVPGDPEGSILVQVQAAGGHPGQFTPEELEAMIGWIAAGAPQQ